MNITFPWFAWVAIGTALTSAVAWLANTYRSSVERTHAETVALAREVTHAMVQNTEVARSQTEILRELSSRLRSEHEEA